MSSSSLSNQTRKASPRCRILAAARELFFSKGVAAVTTDMLVKKAKTSKMTLYKYFANKDQILEQVVANDVSRIFTPLETDISGSDSYTQVVFEFCKNLVDIIFDPEIVRFDQLMVSQALTHTELTQAHYNRTFQPTIDRVIALLELGQQRGYIVTKHPASLLTDMLISSVSGLSYTRAIHGFEDKTTVSNRDIKAMLEIILGLKVSK
jgi:AcrR family transcriptional regulator